MGLTTYPPSGGAAVWGDITGSVSAQTDLTTAFGTQGIKKYVALLTQSGTDAPVATVLENSLGGTVVWARSNVGIYTATLAAAFPAAKTVIIPGSIVPASVLAMPSALRTSDNVITLETWGSDSDTWSLDDAMLSASPIEILVYP